jgi:hypothetical protein
MKEQILRAAQQLIGRGSTPSRLRADDLVASGACSAEQFGQAFPDVATFQRELCAQLFAQARAAVIEATTGIDNGLPQLKRAFETYLDYNLREPALQELAHHVQETAAGLELLQRMELGVALVVQADLDAMNATLRRARARLLTALVVTVVRAEYQARKKLPDLREALMDYCRLSAGPA